MIGVTTKYVCSDMLIGLEYCCLESSLHLTFLLSLYCKPVKSLNFQALVWLKYRTKKYIKLMFIAKLKIESRLKRQFV